MPVLQEHVPNDLKIALIGLAGIVNGLNVTSRFVILRHEGIERPHFDLMFQLAPDAKLSTWRSDHWPIVSPVVLTRLADHRAAYLDYEGPVSGNRGQVRRIAGGVCQITLSENDTFWSFRFADDLIAPLLLKQNAGDQWLAIPSCC